MNKLIIKKTLTLVLVLIVGQLSAQTVTYTAPSQLKTNEAITPLTPQFTSYNFVPYKVFVITGPWSNNNTTRIPPQSLANNRFTRPTGVAYRNNVYIVADGRQNNTSPNSFIKVIDANDQTTNAVTALAFSAPTIMLNSSSPEGIAVHPISKEVFAAGGPTPQLFKINETEPDVSLRFEKIAGGTTTGNTLGGADKALFNNPMSIAFSTDGTEIFIADAGNQRILKATLTKNLTSGKFELNDDFEVFAGQTASAGFADGKNNNAKLANPVAMVIDNADNIYVTDKNNGALRKISKDGYVTTLTPTATYTTQVENTTAVTSFYEFKAIHGIARNDKGQIFVNSSPAAHTITIPKKIWKITNNSIEHILGFATDPFASNSDAHNGTYPGNGTNVYLDYPQHMSIGRYGNLALTTRDDQYLLEAVVEDQFTISPALPAGLKLNDVTGEITGTPTVETPATAYTITYLSKDNDNLNLTSTITFATVTTLPVSLTSFDAKKQSNGNINLTWATSSEIDNNKFVVSKSTNGVNFSTLVERPSLGAQGGNYSFTDVNPANGANYYKLQQINNDGTTTDLGIKVVQGGLTVASWSVYPNPTNGNSVTIKYNGKNTTQAVKFYDVTGRLVQQETITLNGETTINFKQKLAIGIYTINLDKLGTQKIIVK